MEYITCVVLFVARAEGRFDLFCLLPLQQDESAFSVTAWHGKDYGQIIYSPNLRWDGVTVDTRDST
eukprot:SAG31_NODE_6284_length_2085_cov_1.173212_1_plen_65_part_10